jgi:DNA-binding CsgD family transcriptional regulator
VETAQRLRYRAAYDSITRLCLRGLAGPDPFGELAAELRRVVAFRTGGWTRLDPATMLPLPGLLLQAGHDQARTIIRNEYFESDFVRFRDLARQPVPVQTLWQATGGEPRRSVRYRSILVGLGYGDELRAVFRCGGAAWGAACVARSVTDPPFSAEEVSFVARVCEPIARGLRLSHLLAGDGPAAPAPPGVLVLDDDGGVVSQTDAARHWLAQLPPERARGLDLPAAIVGAATAARAPDAAPPGGAPSGNPTPSGGPAASSGPALSGAPALPGAPTGRVRTTRGRWLRVHAARLTPLGAHGSGQTAVILEPAGPAELSPLVLDLRGLTGRERQITQLLLRGLPTADIARSLFISRHTLSDHMKAIFAKLGVSSRAELTALLLDRAEVTPGS